MDFEASLKEKLKLIDNELKKYLKPAYPKTIYDAMNYSMFAGGKRVRAVLTLAACKAVSNECHAALPFACAMEMIHTYSLIHDDLPAMDDDDYRRGHPTNHKVFGEAMAILAGDALLNRAYEVIAEHVLANPDKANIKAMKTIAHAAGVNGMVGGQVADIESENKIIDSDTLLYIHKNKTAALIEASLLSGGLAGGANEEQLNSLSQIGQKMGLAFQIKDDILDVTGDSNLLGKPVNSDEKNNKSTYVSLHSLEMAETVFYKLSKEALSLTGGFGHDGLFLKEYAERLIDRQK